MLTNVDERDILIKLIYKTEMLNVKKAKNKFKKVVDKLEGMRYNKEVRESEQALKKALNIENFIV